MQDAVVAAFHMKNLSPDKEKGLDFSNIEMPTLIFCMLSFMGLMLKQGKVIYKETKE